MLPNNTRSLHGAARNATLAINAIFAVVITGAYGTDMAVHAAVPEVQVTKARITDFEFNQTHAQLTFIDSNYRLWVGKVNTATGAFKPANGQGVLVDIGAAPPTAFGNGPEWLYSAYGDEIVYTKYVPNQPATAENARIAHAAPNTEGVFVPSFVDPTVPYVSPLGSLDIGDTHPRIHYQSPILTSTGYTEGFRWQEIDRPETEELVPNTYGSIGTRRWVNGMNAIIYSNQYINSNGISETQVFLYNTDTKVQEKITSDDGVKSSVWMWKAPEFNNEHIFFALVNSNEIRVYRYLDMTGKGDFQWAVISHIFAPAKAPYFWSPESFTHNGISYIFAICKPTQAVLDRRYPTQVVLTDIADKKFRMLTDATSLLRFRNDPEVFFTDNGPYIYYNSYKLQTPETSAKHDGVWRVDPGLGPANQETVRE